MATLAEWDVMAKAIDQIYWEELGRHVEDIGAQANWLFHWKEEGHDLAWIRASIRDGPEARAHRDTGDPSPPRPAPPAPVPSLGAFRVIPVTDARDGELVPRGYAYWSQAWIRGAEVVVFAGHADNQPRFFTVGLPRGAVARLGPLLQGRYSGTGEGLYWDRDGWVVYCAGARLLKADPFSDAVDTLLDITDSHPGCDLWQAHSSEDGTAHCATVRDAAHPTAGGSYPNIGTLLSRHGQQIYIPVSAGLTLDESAITADGTYVVIKEGDDNRVVNVATGEQRWIRDADGALGHSDCGQSLMVGEYSAGEHGECVVWDLRAPMHMRRLFGTWNLGHVCVRAGRCLWSDTTHLSLIDLKTGDITPLIDHGMVGSDYDHQVQGNLDMTGRVACYLSNNGGSRLDLFLVVIP